MAEPNAALEDISILVVDDRPENLVATQGTLDCLGYPVMTAGSGNEALALMLEHDFAVVLLDVQMPEMDGFETAELMRRNRRTQHIPIVFVTAISKERKFVFKGYEAGAVDYLFKPIEPEILRSKVEVFCQLATQRKRIEAQRQQLAEQLKEIQTLRDIIPICCYCKQIRDDQGYWESVENYMRRQSGARFSHGICPGCFEKHFPEEFEDEPGG